MQKEWTELYSLVVSRRLNITFKEYYSTAKTLVFVANTQRVRGYFAIMHTSDKCYRIFLTAQYHARRRASIDMYLSARTHLDILELLAEFEKDIKN